MLLVLATYARYTPKNPTATAALIVQKSNPRLEEILWEFNETIEILTNKPE